MIETPGGYGFETRGEKVGLILKCAAIGALGLGSVVGVILGVQMAVTKTCKEKQQEKDNAPQQQQEFFQESNFENSQTYDEYNFECEFDRSL